MSALTAPRLKGLVKIIRTLTAPIAAGQKIFDGALCGWKGGYLYEWADAIPDLAHPCIANIGTGDDTTATTLQYVDNTNGANGDKSITVDFVKERVCYLFANDTGTPVAQAHIGGDAWGLDDQTVTGSPGSRSRVGTPWLVVASGNVMGYRAGVYVELEGEAGGSGELLGAAGGEGPGPFYVRNVVFTNVADLSAYTVAADATVNDNVLNVENDVVALVNQTTAAQCGLYRVGTVASGAAPLTRISGMPTGAVMPRGVEFAVAEGDTYKKSKWFATSAQSGGWTVGTHDPTFYPETYKQTVTLASGTYTIGVGSTATPDEPLFLLSGAVVEATLNTAGGTLSTNKLGAPSASRVTGKAGTAKVVINAYVDAGTVQSADTSTVDVLIRNR